MSQIIEFPTPEEYAPFYNGYIQRTKGGNILEKLTRQIVEIQDALGKLSDQQALFRPAPEEWSIKEVLGHIGDSERIFFYRALCISRSETQSLPGFDQEQYVHGTSFDAFSLDELIKEFTLLRQANLISLKRLSIEASLRRGLTNGNTTSTRALVHIMAGHVYHHLESIHNVYLRALKDI